MSVPHTVAEVIGQHVRFEVESIDRMSLMVNHYYFYCVDKEFGPFFIKFCSYFPYNARLCINGHEYAKRQLAKRGIGFEACENAILACDDPAALQRIANGLSAAKINALLRRWLARLPHPFTRSDRRPASVTSSPSCSRSSP